ncbi:MAG: hypothetical protein H6730_32710 [Deltaproteobacteria bacterium]|nr:hypothetical protein [Deltaproteobacteria bacterium]
MKIQGKNDALELPHDEEAAALVRQLEAAAADLNEQVGILARTPVLNRDRRACDGFDRHRAERIPTGMPASSVLPRARAVEGAPMYEVLASGILGADSVDESGRLFAWDSEADTSLDTISTRKLLSYYESSMNALHQALGAMDFYRGEGLWHERYNEDLYLSQDQAAIQAKYDSDYADQQHYRDMEADRMALELEMRARDYDSQYR